MPSKRYKQALEARNDGTTVSLRDGINALGKFPRAKFDESVDIALRLGLDPKHSDQMVRGTVALPNGSGKTVRVVAFTPDGPMADAAKEAGADHVGMKELIEKVEGGWTDFDVAVASPEAMKAGVAKLGRVLGPLGGLFGPSGYDWGPLWEVGGVTLVSVGLSLATLGRLGDSSRCLLAILGGP